MDSQETANSMAQSAPGHEENMVSNENDKMLYINRSNSIIINNKKICRYDDKTRVLKLYFYYILYIYRCNRL